jgi:hypothetical protein
VSRYGGKITNSVVRNAKALREDIEGLNYRFHMVRSTGGAINTPLDGVAPDGVAELRALLRELTELLSW